MPNIGKEIMASKECGTVFRVQFIQTVYFNGIQKNTTHFVKSILVIQDNRGQVELLKRLNRFYQSI